MDQLRNLPLQPKQLSTLIEVRKGQVVSMSLSRNDHAYMTLFAFSKGEEVSEETYFGDTLYYVVEGKMTLAKENKTFDLNTGDIMAVPSTIPHALVAIEDLKMLQINLYK